MGEGQGHDHTHDPNKKILKVSWDIIILYRLVEFIGGLITISQALLAHGGHE